MYTTVDGLGEWFQLGAIKPINYNQWYDLTPEHQYYSGDYRLTFTGTDFPKVGSFCWVRSVYMKDGEELYSLSRRVWPKIVPLRIDQPIPSSLRQSGVDRQRLQLKKLLKRRTSHDIIWTVKVEQLYLEAASENTFPIMLNRIVSTNQHPQYPELYITTLEADIPYESYAVGRYYSEAEIVSDPYTEIFPRLLRATFTGRRPINPGEINVRIVV